MSPIIPPYRSASQLRAAVAAEDLEHAPDLQPGYGAVGRTYCNVAAERICRRLGRPLPPGLLANQQAQWLYSDDGRRAGWTECSEPTAMALAAAGQPVIAAWFNLTGHGHIGVLVPAPKDATECHVAAAGVTNHSDIRRSGTFGKNLPLYFSNS